MGHNQYGRIIHPLIPCRTRVQRRFSNQIQKETLTEMIHTTPSRGFKVTCQTTKRPNLRRTRQATTSSFHGGETTSCARGDCIGTGCTNVIRWVTVWRAGVRGLAVVAPAIARRPVCCVQRGGAVWVVGGGAVVLLCGRCGGGGGVCHV